MTDLKALLAELHVKLGEELVARVLSGKATPADLNVARQFLKDNGIDAIAREGSPLRKLAIMLPFTDPEAPITKAGT